VEAKTLQLCTRDSICESDRTLTAEN
jgi:hypothetical protein